MSTPSASGMMMGAKKHALQPAGLSAANVLGLTSQVPMRPVIATTSAAMSLSQQNDRAIVKTRRPSDRRKLSQREGAVLEVLRDRASTSDVGFRQTRARLLEEISNEQTFRKLVQASKEEPPRVRAMLGALGEEANADPALLQRLRRSLNPLSTYDFGILRQLKTASDWQAK